MIALDLRGERADRLAQLERGPHGPQGVVLVDDGQPEDPDGGVAGDVPDRSAVALEHVGAGRRAAFEHGVQGLRVEPLGQLRHARDLDEHEAHEPARASGLARGRRRRDRRRLGRRLERKRGILREHRAFELTQPLARLDAELVDQQPPRFVESLQGVGLTVTAIQGQHQLAVQPLAVGMLGDQLRQPADDRGVTAERELGVDLQLERGDAQLGEPRDRRLGELLVGDVRERVAAPQCEGPVERGRGRLRATGRLLALRLGHEPLEAVGIDALRIDDELVAGLACHDDAAAVQAPVERLAQPRDLDLDRLRGRRRSPRAPELVDQPVGAERLVRVEQEQREEGALLPPPERDDAALVEDLEWTEDVEVHGSGSQAVRSNLPRSQGARQACEGGAPARAPPSPYGRG